MPWGKKSVICNENREYFKGRKRFLAIFAKVTAAKYFKPNFSPRISRKFQKTSKNEHSVRPDMSASCQWCTSYVHCTGYDPVLLSTCESKSVECLREATAVIPTCFTYRHTRIFVFKKPVLRNLLEKILNILKKLIAVVTCINMIQNCFFPLVKYY